MYERLLLKINKELFLQGKISREVYDEAEKRIINEGNNDKNER